MLQTAILEKIMIESVADASVKLNSRALLEWFGFVKVPGSSNINSHKNNTL